MALRYCVIEIFTNEETRHEGRSLEEAVVQLVQKRKIAARCLVTKGIAGCYESGEIATQGLEVLSFNLPIKIEIVLPEAELPTLLPVIEAMVTDGILSVRDIDVRSHRVKSRLLPRQTKVRDVMTKEPQAVRDDTPVSEIVRLLMASEFNAVPVVDESGRVSGIITQGDLIRRANMPVRLGLLSALEREDLEALYDELAALPAEKIASQPVETITADALLVDAVDLMLKKSLKRLPVVDRDGRLEGILSRVDIFRAVANVSAKWSSLSERNVVLSDLRLVRDIMRTDTHVVQSGKPIPDAIRLIGTNDIQRVAVVDGNGRLLGLLSDRTLIGAFAETKKGFWKLLARKIGSLGTGSPTENLAHDLQSHTVDQVMITDLVTVQEETTIDEAARLMFEKSIKRLPVLDAEGKFKGMISRDSLLRAGMVGK